MHADGYHLRLHRALGSLAPCDGLPGFLRLRLDPRDAQRDESRQAKRSLTTLRESRRAEKWNGNERNIDTCEYERCTKQEGLQKKEARGVSKSLRSSHQATVHILGKRSRKPIDGDFQWRSGSKTSIASHALVPTETPMRPL